MTPAVARLYEAISAEGIAIAGSPWAPRCRRWRTGFDRVYGVREATLVETCPGLTYNGGGPYQAARQIRSIKIFITEKSRPA